MNWLDIMILLIVAWVAVRGITRGLIKSVTGIVAMVAGFLAGNLLYGEVAGFLKTHTGVFAGIREFFNREFFSNLRIPEFESDFSDITREIFQQGRIWRGYPGSDFGEFMATVLLNILSWLLVFFIVVLLVTILGVVVDTVFKLPVLKTLNALGGFVFGIVKGTMYVFFIVIVMDFFGGIAQSSYLKDLIQGSIFAEVVLGYNIFTWINF
ncbi:MAG: hypothetical protein AVO33_03220 [delta proteobacterium ML8_F1]|nr:MAG: hypothetical protein AVO33_03220 [delta proteobacterium ML8_F1]